MADYYVNFESSSYGLGTDSTPYGSDQFFSLSYGYITPGDVFHIKGSLDTSRDICLGSSLQSDMTLTGWSPNINGPWRINGRDCTFFQIFPAFIEGGIINRNEGVPTGGTKLYNCMFRSPYVSFGNSTSIEGSIISVDLLEVGCGASLNAKDTLFEVGSFITGPGNEYTKCAFKGDYPIGTITNCAKDWTTTFPAWNASKESWRIDHFIGGIDSTIKNGSAPYSNYPTDLWGNPRSRIGTGFMPGSANYFDATAVSDGSSVISNSYPEYLVEAIQNKGSDAYFDTTSEISRAVVFYTHQDGRQNMRVVHTAPNHTARVSWPSGARDGTWQKTMVKVYDANNAMAILTRADMDSSHDLVHSGGTMLLNIA